MLAAVSALVLRLRAGRPSTKKVARQRGTIMLAIDTSGSMAATDVTPTRLVAAQAAARRFISGLPAGLKIGLLPFDTTARVLVAPTADHAPVLAGVDAADDRRRHGHRRRDQQRARRGRGVAAGRGRQEGARRDRADERRFADDRAIRADARRDR